MRAIEKLTVDTLADMADIGHAFANEFNHPGGFSFEAFSAQWIPMLNAGIGEIFSFRKAGRVVGILGAAFVAECFSGRMTAMEQLWYVFPEHRGGLLPTRLFIAFEEEAKRRQCKKILMVHLVSDDSERLGAFYRSRGYHLAEQTYCKEI